MTAFDLLIKDALIFDGSGTTPVEGDVAIKEGKVAAHGKDLDEMLAARVVDGRGQWLMPGLLDIHTHYDLEVELAPGLPESVRHGTTTVVVANCSLGLAFGNLRDGVQDPVVDCFARVENVPKPVLSAVADKADWTTSRQYLDHLDGLALGPNIVPMVPYSMLRIAAMGTDASVTRDPSPQEMTRMETLLRSCMEEGYAGFSSDNLPFHYLANDPNRERRIPSQYAGFKELKRLTGIVREFGRIWQATPPTDNPLKVLRSFMLTSGRLNKKPLKITAVAALDVRSNRNIIRSAHILARLLNSPLVKGKFYLQSLAARFKVWGDGPVTPLSEEIPEMRELMIPDLEDDEARRKIYEDAGFEERFKAMWRKGKAGYNLDRLKRMVRLEDLALRRDLSEMVVDRSPVASWSGQSLQAIFDRLRQYQTQLSGAQNDDEKAIFDEMPIVIDDADFMFALFKKFDRDLYWHTISANFDEKKIRKLTMSETFLPGFSDAGAHLTNLAFYDVNLRALKIAHEERGHEGVAFMVKRLTRDPADVFGVETGSIAPGAKADIVLINPNALAHHDGEAETHRIHRELLGHDQLVNRSDGVVTKVFIAGEEVWDGQSPTETLGTRKLGDVLLAEQAA
ncbi:MAG: amidohydrolase family protein [Pseudomonadota bacterium]